MTAAQEIAIVAEYLHRAHRVPQRRAIRAAGRGYLRARRRRPLEVKLATPASEHTGGMVCLVPDAASARKLALSGAGAEPRDQLHLTLAYLGDDVVSWPRRRAAQVVDAARRAIGRTPGIVRARAFAHTTFNADGGPDGDRDPCAVYGIGDSTMLAPLHQHVIDALAAIDGIGLPKQHEPWVPHVTATYKGTAADLSYLGPVVFDRVAVVLGPRWVYLPLGATVEAATRRDEGQVLELASRNGQHIPGTPYSWRHGWIPLHVATALRYGKTRHAARLHAAGADFHPPDAPGVRQVRGGLEGRRLNVADLDDDALESNMQVAIRAERFDLLDELGAEAERRDRDRDDPEQSDDLRRLDEMVALIEQGMPEADAHAEVYGGDPEEFRRKQVISELRAQGYVGKGFDELARDSFKQHVAAEFMRAEQENRGYLLSREAQIRNAAAKPGAKMIDPRDLFEGPAHVARKHASEELRRWWDANGRPTFEEWKTQLLDPSAAVGIRARRDVFAA